MPRIRLLEIQAQVVRTATRFPFRYGIAAMTAVHDALARVKADCIVVNMVLHHTPEPAAVLSDIADCLAEGGVVLVTDLCRHDQAWARENCGDLWLGFAPEDLADWAGRAGLAEIASVYLAQRNGFKVQVRLFGHRND